MFPRFDIDAQRGLICLFGLIALTAEGVAFYFTQKTLPEIFTGAFITMAIGPVLTNTIGKYRESSRLDQEPQEPQSQSAQKPPPRRSKRSTGGGGS